jgi:hypothetical protein
MGQTTAAFGAGLRDQIKAGTMTTAQAQAAQNNFVKQQVAMRTAQAPSPAQIKPAPPARELPTQTGAQQQALQAALNTAPGMTPTPVQLPQRTSFSPPINKPNPGFQNSPNMQLTAPTGPAPAGPPTTPTRMKKGGKVAKPPVKKMAKGGSTASSRGDGCAIKGKTKGRFV